MSTALVTLAGKFAERFSMGDSASVLTTLKATAFKGNVSDAQMAALLIVADQYKLNPFTKEIYAFPDKNNGIVPVVGVDGWSRIINERPELDGIEFQQDDESCTCLIWRKDRAKPVAVTEYMSECKRGAGPWLSHPKRMLRHKALIQCARLAFGFAGIYDQDEAERIAQAEKDITPSSPTAYGEAARAVPVDSPERDELIKQLEAAANTGDRDALNHKWGEELTKEQRLLVGSKELQRLKELVEQAAIEDVTDD